MDIARIEVKRAQNEYERCPLKTTFDRDRKENLLDCVRDRENRYAALAYRYEDPIADWQKLVSAIKTSTPSIKNSIAMGRCF